MPTITRDVRASTSAERRSHQFGIYRRIFLNPVDRSTHFVRHNGRWYDTKLLLPDRLFHDHLAGKKTIGYKADKTQSGCVAFDIDNHDGNQDRADRDLKAIVTAIRAVCGALPIIEQSAINGGYHVYVPLMNGKYAEFADKIRLFADYIKSKASVDCEVFGAGCKTGNFRAPLSNDYRLVCPVTGIRTSLTGYNAIERIQSAIEQGLYISNYAIKLERIPSQIKQRRAHIGIDQHALRTAQIFEQGLSGAGQRIKSITAIYAYLTDYLGNSPGFAVRELEQWIITKHNGQSVDINANTKQGIRASIAFIRELPNRQHRYTGTRFYFPNMTGAELSSDAVLLINHLLNLVHYCSINGEYFSASGFKVGHRYFVSIPYSNAVRDKFSGFKHRSDKRFKAELELERYGLIYRDPQTKVFLPARGLLDSCTHLCINVSALFGYKSARDIRTKYKDKFCDERSQEFLREASKQYTQTEISELLDVSQQTISKWLKSGKIPVRHQVKLYALGQI